MEMREVQVRVVDHGTYRGFRTSRNIKRKEYTMIYPDREPKRLDFIFKQHEEKLMPEKQAKFLIRKHGELIEIIGAESIKLQPEEKALYDVDNMKRQSMINLAARMDIQGCMQMKNDVLRETIKASILRGVVPLTQEEYEVRRAERA